MKPDQIREQVADDLRNHRATALTALSSLVGELLDAQLELDVGPIDIDEPAEVTTGRVERRARAEQAVRTALGLEESAGAATPTLAMVRALIIKLLGAQQRLDQISSDDARSGTARAERLQRIDAVDIAEDAVRTALALPSRAEIAAAEQAIADEAVADMAAMGVTTEMIADAMGAVAAEQATVTTEQEPTAPSDLLREHDVGRLDVAVNDAVGPEHADIGGES